MPLHFFQHAAKKKNGIPLHPEGGGLSEHLGKADWEKVYKPMGYQVGYLLCLFQIIAAAVFFFAIDVDRAYLNTAAGRAAAAAEGTVARRAIRREYGHHGRSSMSTIDVDEDEEGEKSVETPS